MASKVRFKDLPAHACFRPKLKANPGKKLARDLVRWHGDSGNNLVLQGKPRAGMLTSESLVIPVPCPGERTGQSAMVLAKCRRLHQRYRGLQTDLNAELRTPAGARDHQEIVDLEERIGRVMFDAMDLNCGWTDTE